MFPAANREMGRKSFSGDGHLLRRAFRNLPSAAEASVSWLRLRYLRFCYPDFRFGKGVLLRRGAKLRMVPGAHLTLGDRVVIDRGAVLASESTLTIGPESFVGQNSMIIACQSITIGPDALIAENVTIRDQDHGTARDQPYRLQPVRTAAIRIGANVWLGAGVVVLKGVEIGDGAIAGAGAVITRSVPARHRAVGIPAVTAALSERG